MGDFCLIARGGQVLFYRFRDHDGAVVASGAAEAYRQVTLAFADVMGHEPGQHFRHFRDKFFGLRK